MDDLHHVFDLPNALNVIYWWEFFEMVEGCKFDVVMECGVGRGRSLISILTCDLFRSLETRKPNYQILALDSFRGFPSPGGEDRSFRNPRKGDWAKSPSGKYRYSPHFLLRVLRLAGFTMLNHLKIIPGFFSETIPKVIQSQPKIGILHLDGDLYRSILDPLVLLGPLVVPGGVIVLDDLRLAKQDKKEPFPGARKALDDFMKTPDAAAYQLKSTSRGNPFFIKNKQ